MTNNRNNIIAKNAGLATIVVIMAILALCAWITAANKPKTVPVVDTPTVSVSPSAQYVVDVRTAYPDASTVDSGSILYAGNSACNALSTGISEPALVALGNNAVPNLPGLSQVLVTIAHKDLCPG